MTRPTVEKADMALKRANSSHKVRLIADWVDMDDDSGHVECSCGWRSRDVRCCWLRNTADDHISEMSDESA
jgi:hypothetical protein